MLYDVLRKQPNSQMCLVCGLENQLGLKARFFELSGELLLGIVAPRHEYQGYPGRLHGGAASTILDETLGRTIMIHQPDSYWGVTIDLQIRFRQAIPLDQPIRAVAQLTENGKRSFRATGRIVLDNGQTAVEARGRFLKMAIEQIADFDPQHQAWGVHPHPDDPTQIEL